MVPPGEVASPFLSTAPAVPAPCVLASFGEGFVVVPLSIWSPAVAFEAGAPVCPLLPAALPCARAPVLASARAAASEMHFIFIFVSRLLHAPLINCDRLHTFLKGMRCVRRQARRREAAIITSDAVGEAASGVQVCRSTARKRTAPDHFRQGFGFSMRAPDKIG